MTKISPLKLALATIGLAIGIVGVLALRCGDAVDARGGRCPRRRCSSSSARTRGGEAGQNLAEMVEAQLLTCRLEVTSDLAGPIEPLGDGRFRAVLEPAMDRTNRRQFRGCVEDFITDHLQIDVLELEAID